MARITVEDCLEQVQNRFALVVLAGKRAKQILSGSPVLIDDRRDNKAIVTSLREIAAGKVSFQEATAIEESAETTETLSSPTSAAEALFVDSASSSEAASENGSADSADATSVAS